MQTFKNTLFFLVAFLSTLQCLSAQLTCSQSLCRFGECEQLEFDFRCHCDPGVKGILCDRLLKEGDNLCLSSPCWNGTKFNINNQVHRFSNLRSFLFKVVFASKSEMIFCASARRDILEKVVELSKSLFV